MYFFRVVQKNLVFVVGLTQRLADPEVRLISGSTEPTCSLFYSTGVLVFPSLVCETRTF